jgi:hypothetical protein
MKSIRGLVVVASAAAFALPASAAMTSTTGDRPKDEVAALRAKVKRLEADNKRLAAKNKALVAKNKALVDVNKTIGQRWDEVLRREEALKKHLATVDPCPITRPNNSEPPGPTFGAEFEGNGALWVGLWGSNIVSWQREADGSIDAKFGWWREVHGKLKIEGRRLDGPAPPLTADVPDGYGDAGFQATGIVFPTDGCWQVTGSVGNASLTFVTLVVGA